MTITYRSGDIFAEEVDALVNPVNCVGVMGAGLALEFKKRWPEYEFNYVNDCHMGRVKLRQVMAHVGTWPRGRPVHLISFPTKRHWRDRSHIDDIGYGMDSLGNFLKDKDNIQSVAIPALGCGLGGLDWEPVKGLIEQMLGCFLHEKDIRVYEPHS